MNNASQKKGAPALSVVIRAHDPTRIDELRVAVGSLVAQTTGEALEILLCTSGDWSDLELEDLVGSQTQNAAGPRQFLQIKTSYQGDSRVHLLKRGIPVAEGVYVAALDFDDRWLPDAAERLLTKARVTGAVVTFGAADLAFFKDGESEPFRVVPYCSFPFTLMDLLRHNVAPFNSYIIERRSLLPHLAQLPNVKLFEDYHLLLGALSEGEAAWLDDELPVSEYRVDLGKQSDKYADVAPQAWQEILSLKERLSFRVPGLSLLADNAGALRAIADREMLEAIPVGRNASVYGLVEEVIETGAGHLVTGWCINARDRSTDISTVLIETEDGNVWLAPTRFDRRDVGEVMGHRGKRAGFARVVPSRPAKVWAVAARRKYTLYMPGKTPSLAARAMRRLWRLVG